MLETAASTIKNPMQMMPIKDLFIKTWQIYVAGFWKFMGMMGLSVIGMAPIAFTLVAYKLLGEIFIRDKAYLAAIIVLGLIFLVFVIFAIAVSVIAQAGLYILIMNPEPRISVWEAFNRGRQFAWRLVIIDLLSALYVLGGLAALLLPGFYFLIANSFAIWLLFHENASGSLALKRSRDLVHGYWWPVCARYLVVYLLFGIITGMFESGDGAQTTISAVNVISQIIQLAAAPFVIIYSFCIFQDLHHCHQS